MSVQFSMTLKYRSLLVDVQRQRVHIFAGQIGNFT